MNAKNFLTAGIAGGVVYFFLGWLVYGVLLADLMKEYAGSATGVDRGDQMIFWALIIGNLLSGFLLSYVFTTLGNVTTAAAGARAGAWLGALMAGSVDFTMYGLTNLIAINGVFIDILVFSLISAIAGAITAWFAGMGQKVMA
jgi:hypothetical protein